MPGRRCDVCGHRYVGAGRCALAPVCPRSSGRRRGFPIEARKQLWEDFQVILHVYAIAVRAWLDRAWPLAVLETEPDSAPY